MPGRDGAICTRDILSQLDEARRFVADGRPEHHPVDDGKNAGVEAETECECEDRRRRQSRVLANQPYTETQIVEQVAQHPSYWTTAYQRLFWDV